ncbi:MAG: hypothetical protein OXM61_12350 [Candidatus Poribacteria bacterium]|nr:hypothetical protein [Candidatus Poribacteria bacterium]
MEIYCSARHKNFRYLLTISYNIGMKNQTLAHKNIQDNHLKEQEYVLFKQEYALYNEMLSELKVEFQKAKKEVDNADRAKKMFQCIVAHSRLVLSKDRMCRRENIESRGYDTNAYVTAQKYKEEQAAKNQKTDTSQHNATQNGQPEQSDRPEQSDEIEQPAEEPQELTHLHPEMEQYQSCLPKQDDKNDTGRSDLRNANKTGRSDLRNATKSDRQIATASKQPTPKQKPPRITYNPNGFRPHGQMRDLFKSHANIKVAGGTYDAGKTFSCVAYIDQLARNYPGARLTFVHRSLKRVYKNIVPTYEKYLGFRPRSRADPNPTPITRYGGEHPDFFEYWNGSRIYMNGLDKPQNLLSDFFDAAFVNQAELVSFDTWDELTARVSERAGTLPIAFLIGDCNPSTPNHWIRQQTKAGKLAYFEMTFRDNPEIYNQQTGELTEKGKRRVQRLQNLEGLRYKRGYEGKWVSGEGLVFDTFLPEVHVIDNFTISTKWERYISIDWGFRNPSCCIWWARSPDDRIYAYKEIYKTKLTKPDFIRMIKANCDASDRIRYAAVDSADQDAVEQLQRAGFRVRQPKKSRTTQIDAIKERLKVDATGAPAIFFLRDRLVHPPDEDLKDTYRPLEVTDEFLSCTYDENMRGTNRDDEAIKGDNHGIDSTAYFILSLQNRQSIGSGRVIHGAVQLR